MDKVLTINFAGFEGTVVHKCGFKLFLGMNLILGEKEKSREPC